MIKILMMNAIIKKYYAFLIAITVFLTDRLIKGVISQNMLFNDNFTILNNFISITKIYNTGAAFGILQDKTVLLAIFSILVAIIISVYLVKISKSISFISAVAWGLILGGTVGNVVDRLSLGYVLDFIRIDFVNFPIFNIADLCINAGATLLIIYMFVVSDNKQSTKELSNSPCHCEEHP